ncbi:glycosyltransferase family 4 protein [Photobacterium carnosum]|uniref:glycosyltransferase family 4 protein n=1 Tax=Photobacterium carnosum TaxID=2023717 RepID=UPI001F2D999B|nr:glycosyltransferase family 4 protein [Photobacterium carnosum]
MKLLFINHALHCGGTDRVMLTLAKEMANRGNDVYFLTFRPRDEDFFDIPDNITRLDLNFKTDDSIKGFAYIRYNIIGYLLKLRNIIKTLNPDYVISAWTSTNIFVILASLKLKTKLIITEHIHFDAPPKIWKFLRYFFYRLSYKLVVLTNRDRAKFLNVLPKNKIEVISNPLTIDVPRVIPNREFKTNKSNIKFLSVGRFTSQKGFDLLLQSFKKVLEIIPSAQLTIVGDGEDYELIKNQAKKLRISNNIFLPGLTNNVSYYYEHNDIYVLSSRFEGFGLVITEAMSYGMPIISFDCPTGPREIIKNNEYGILINSNNINSLADKMIYLASNYKEFNNYSKASLKRANDYSISTIVDMWEFSILKNKGNH